MRLAAAAPPPDRVPPHNFEAEQALLGAILVNNRVLDQVATFLRPEHFADPVHGRIYAACRRLADQGHVASPVSLKTLFESDAQLHELGGLSYLVRLAGSVASLVNAEDYGRLVFDLHLRRELITLAERLRLAAADGGDGDTAQEVMDAHDAALTALADSGRPGSAGLRAAAGFADAILGSWEAAGQGRHGGVPTGLRGLDRRLLGGLKPGHLVILAGRPSMGKTQLAVSIALAAARASHPVAFFSLEMPGDELSGRMIAALADLDYERSQLGRLEPADWERAVAARQALAALPLQIDDTAAPTLAAIRAQCRRLARKGLGLVVVDYLGLVQPAGPATQQRVHQIEDLTKGLKALAKELAVPVLLLSQLSRACELREDKRPQLSDLRDSGAIEQDADAVLLVFREQYYLERGEPMRRPDEDDGRFALRYAAWEQRCAQAHNVAEVLMPKLRGGRVGSVRLFCDLSRMRFGDLMDEEGETHGH
jgi:replicative DNA helicase